MADGMLNGLPCCFTYILFAFTISSRRINLKPPCNQRSVCKITTNSKAHIALANTLVFAEICFKFHNYPFVSTVFLQVRNPISFPWVRSYWSQLRYHLDIFLLSGNHFSLTNRFSSLQLPVSLVLGTYLVLQQ